MNCHLLALVLAAVLGGPGAGAATADFRGEPASPQARHLADWAVDSADAGGRPFVVVDKLQSRVFLFDAAGRLLGAAPALLGLAAGDASVPGIGQRPLGTIRPQERTTPAGRFVASLDRAANGDEILWVDYEAAIALHRVAAGAVAERRLQRLASLLPADRRITYGCINVPVSFFENLVAPAFRATDGVVYVLPETRTTREVFGSHVPAAMPPATPAR